MSKALIVYGTRYGAAASTSEEIAKIFSKEGIKVKIVNGKEEKINNIAEYDLVVVGSGIQIHRWTGEPGFPQKIPEAACKQEGRAFCLLRFSL